MYFNVVFEKYKCLVCVFGNVISVVSPAEVFGYTDP